MNIRKPIPSKTTVLVGVLTAAAIAVAGAAATRTPARPAAASAATAARFYRVLETDPVPVPGHPDWRLSVSIAQWAPKQLHVELTLRRAAGSVSEWHALGFVIRAKTATWKRAAARIDTRSALGRYGTIRMTFSAAATHSSTPPGCPGSHPVSDGTLKGTFRLATSLRFFGTIAQTSFPAHLTGSCKVDVAPSTSFPEFPADLTDCHPGREIKPVASEPTVLAYETHSDRSLVVGTTRAVRLSRRAGPPALGWISDYLQARGAPASSFAWGSPSTTIRGFGPFSGTLTFAATDVPLSSPSPFSACAGVPLTTELGQLKGSSFVAHFAATGAYAPLKTPITGVYVTESGT